MITWTELKRMIQTIQLKEPLNSAIVGTPFPAEVDLTFSRVNGHILVHHPENPKVTKIVKAPNVLRIGIQGCSIREIIKAHFDAVTLCLIPSVGTDSSTAIIG
jgi:hypothetical protein